MKAVFKDMSYIPKKNKLKSNSFFELRRDYLPILYRNPVSYKKVSEGWYKSLFTKENEMYHRALKIYWSINLKNEKYRKTKKDMYSCWDIFKITKSNIQNDNMNEVCRRTFARDITRLKEYMQFIKN